MTLNATRTRPYVDPHPITEIQKDAIDHRKKRFEERRKAIDELVSKSNSKKPDIMYWTMVYDLEMAPTITGRALLLESGIIPTGIGRRSGRPGR